MDTIAILLFIAVLAYCKWNPKLDYTRTGDWLIFYNARSGGRSYFNITESLRELNERTHF